MGQVIKTEQLTELTARELLDGFSRKVFSPVEVVEAFSERIIQLNEVLGAFLSLSLDQALREARSAERRFVRREGTHQLEGVPVAVKDIFDTADLKTTYGSRMFADYVPSGDAAALSALRSAGAILLGKTATHEFAWGITSINPHFGVCRNPWSLDRIPGGSSGGSAAAVAARLAPVALASDTGGSTRIPAAFCGVVGLKPSYGRVDSAGMLPLAPSLDHVGVVTRTPADAALLLEVLSPSGNRLDGKSGTGEWGNGKPGRPLTVGVCRDLHFVPLAEEVERIFAQTLEILADAGVEVVEIRHRDAGSELEVFRVVQLVEALKTHRSAGLFPARSAEYGTDIRARLNRALALTNEDYVAAQHARLRIGRGYGQLLQKVDVLVTSVAPCSAPPIVDEASLGSDELLRDMVMPYTVPQNLTGLPACSVRGGIDSTGLPVGIQFTGRAEADLTVLQVASVFFEATREMQALQPTLRNPLGTKTRVPATETSAKEVSAWPAETRHKHRAAEKQAGREQTNVAAWKP